RRARRRSAQRKGPSRRAMAAARARRSGRPAAAQVPARTSTPPARRGAGRIAMKKIMSSKAARIVAMLFALLTGIDAHAAQVRAWLDRNSMQLGETVTLNVEVSDNAGAAQPDFNALQ